MIGYIEAVTGIGLILGPLLGSILYALGGYSFAFFFFGALFMIFSLFIRRMLPTKIDNS